jgi:hypothetical protein
MITEVVGTKPAVRPDTPVKLNRHVAIALNHMKQERDTLDKKIATLTAERVKVHKAILEIEPE